MMTRLIMCITALVPEAVFGFFFLRQLLLYNKLQHSTSEIKGMITERTVGKRLYGKGVERVFYVKYSFDVDGAIYLKKQQVSVDHYNNLYYGAPVIIKYSTSNPDASSLSEEFLDHTGLFKSFLNFTLVTVLVCTFLAMLMR